MVYSDLVIVLQLIFLEGILSIDNAAVLGAMVVDLPDTTPIFWPKLLQKTGRALHPLLGNQRTAALRVGILGAYVGRGLMLFLASIIIQNPWLKLLGAAYLVRLAFDNLGIAETGEGDAHVHPILAKSFWMVVINVELADLAFSIDNVVAAVSLSNRIVIVLIGVALGILLMRFAAGLFSYAVEREPVLKSAAYILVLNIGIELIYSEIAHVAVNEWLQFAISILTLLLALGYAHSSLLKSFRPVLVWIAQGFANLNELIDWALVPIIGLFKWLFRIIKMIPGLKRLPREV